MAVNGIELQVGQKWRCRDGESRVVTSYDGSDTGFPWSVNGAFWVTRNGRDYDDKEGCIDLIELLSGPGFVAPVPEGFTPWAGGEQPAETVGKRVHAHFRDTTATADAEQADDFRWENTNSEDDIVAYKVVVDTPAKTDIYEKLYRAQCAALQPAMDIVQHNAGYFGASAGDDKGAVIGKFFTNWASEKLAAPRPGVIDDYTKPDTREYTGGKVNYYEVEIKSPTREGRAPYTAECNDIIEALGMTFAEGEAFKANWRGAAARKNLSKRGYTDGLYDAEKVVFYGQRMVVQQKGGV